MNDYEYIDFKEFIVSDLALASCLLHLGFAVIALDRDPKDYPKVGFVFKKSIELDNVVIQFWNGSLLVEPKGFWDASRGLKSRIHSDR